nr:glycosyltransferase family 4 protein [Candidatus Dojkabacteria bacterium]
KGVDIILDQIRTESPDILHTVYIEETLISQIANLNYGIPHIVTHTKTPMYREESIIKNSTWSLFDFVNKNTSVKYITPGLAYRSSLLQTGIKSESIHLVYPGIDQKVFKKIHNSKILNTMRKRLKITKEDSVILIPCMLRKRKGLGFVADTLSKLSIPNHKIKVIISGIPKNDEELLIYQDFKKRIGNVAVVDHDWFSNEDMPVLFNIADTMVLCSEAEGYGTVFLEAMACGCPVIGTNVIGINESITNGYNGILCEYGDNNELSSAVTKMLKDKKFRNRFIKNSFLVLKNKYNLRKQAENHIKLYRANSKRDDLNAECILYRYLNSQIEVYIFKNNKSYYNVPSSIKKANESWLQTSIKIARAFCGYQVTIPNHLIECKFDQNKIIYSFKIDENTKQLTMISDKDNLGMWMTLDKAITLVNKEIDKNILQEFKSCLYEDQLVQKEVDSLISTFS